MRKIVRIFLPVVLIVISIAVVGGLIARNNQKRPEREEVAVQATMVDAIPVERVSLNLSVFSQGSVAPRTETTLVAEVAGIIVNVSPNFVAGGFFRKGETLLEIDPSDYQAGLKRAQANLASRKAGPVQTTGPSSYSNPGNSPGVAIQPISFGPSRDWRVSAGSKQPCWRIRRG